MVKEYDELKKLEEKKEVFSLGGPFEVVSSKELVKGKYWAEAEERDSNLSGELNLEQDEKQKKIEIDKRYPLNRRSFLKLMGIGAAAGAASCVRKPAEKAIAYVQQPVDHVTGQATHYATTCNLCPSACGMLAKTKEGRLVKLEGLEKHSLSQGSLCSLGQAQVQGLYHPERLKGPLVKGSGGQTSASNWDVIYKELAGLVKSTKKIGIFTGGATGNRHRFFKEVLLRLGAKKENLFTWESNGLIASLQTAHEIAMGTRSMPRVELSKAKFLVGIGSDFQDVGVAANYLTRGFTRFHSYNNGHKGEFVQFESHLTLTGGKADKRYVIPPSSELSVALFLLQQVFEKKEASVKRPLRKLISSILKDQGKKIEEAKRALHLKDEDFSDVISKLAKKGSVVLAGSTSLSKDGTLLQLATLLINQMIGAYDHILELKKGALNPVFNPKDLDRFKKNAKDLDVLFVVESNPAFTLPESWGFKKIVSQVKKVVSIQYFPNETDELADYILPSHHPLEAWGDHESVSGFLSVQQPVMRAVTESRQAEDIFLWILAHAKRSLPYDSYRSYLKERWKNFETLKLTTPEGFENKYKRLLATGFTGKLKERRVKEVRSIRLYFQSYGLAPLTPRLVVPFDNRFLDGRGAHLPVLQEIGDALTTIAWDSFVALSPKKMEELGVRKNQVVQLTTEQGSLELAAYPLPGLHKDSVVVSRGNGHTDKRSTISYQNGHNPLQLLGGTQESLSLQPLTQGQEVKITPLKKWYRLAAMQKNSDLNDRKDIVKEYSVAELAKLKNDQNLDDVPDLYPKMEKNPHSPYRWGMAIDLDKCNGCGACTTACTIENNIPQVGRDQILLGREMHWIRRDRYFSGTLEDPKVTFQPVMCQHCNHAPCESVCPVYATTHEPEGLNAMTYNRCVGTRYCANACPYKVRRFNWWTHKWGEMGENAYSRNPRATNPEVTVRTRGVMEKCSLCVGRIREKKHLAKADGREVADGEIKTACQQTCPTNAIVFGNLNDPKSEISKLRRNKRSYLLLGADPRHKHYGLKTLPNINYLAKVNLDDQSKNSGHGEHH